MREGRLSRLETWRTAKAVVEAVGAVRTTDMGSVARRLAGMGLPRHVAQDVREVAIGMLDGSWPERVEFGAAEADAFFASLSRPAARAVAAPSGGPTGSRIHGNPWLADGTDWPVDDDGVPLRFLAQFDSRDVPEAVLATLPTRFGILSLFVADLQAPDVAGGGCFLLDMDREAPGGARPRPGARRNPPPAKHLAFEVVDDLPRMDDPSVRLPEGFDRATARRTELGDRWSLLPNVEGTKIGGWASGFQTNPPLAGLERTEDVRTPFLLQIGDLGRTGWATRRCAVAGTIFVGWGARRAAMDGAAACGNGYALDQHVW